MAELSVRKWDTELCPGATAEESICEALARPSLLRDHFTTLKQNPETLKQKPGKSQWQTITSIAFFLCESEGQLELALLHTSLMGPVSQPGGFFSRR